MCAPCLLADVTNPEQGAELVELEPGLFRDVDKDWLIAFSEDASGEITSLFVGSALRSYHRIPWYTTLHVLVAVTALSFLVFIYAGARDGWTLLRRKARLLAEPSWVRLWRLTRIRFCVANGAFAAGFAPLLVWNPDIFRYPPGTVALLALPFVGLGLTLLAVVFVTIAWYKRHGTPGSRLRELGVTLTSILFLMVLDMWNILGWRL